MRIEWSPEAQAAFGKFTRDDRRGMFEAAAAVAALTEDPAPPESFPYGTERRRLRAGDYRIMYRVDGDVITVVHVARRI